MGVGHTRRRMAAGGIVPRRRIPRESYGGFPEDLTPIHVGLNGGQSLGLFPTGACTGRGPSIPVS